jgi:hypothetical protein
MLMGSSLMKNVLAVAFLLFSNSYATADVIIDTIPQRVTIESKAESAFATGGIYVYIDGREIIHSSSYGYLFDNRKERVTELNNTLAIAKNRGCVVRVQDEESHQSRDNPYSGLNIEIRQDFCNR